MKNTIRPMIDVVIVGGGISGLYAAQKCLAQGLTVVLLEKSVRLGGRIYTVYNKDGYFMEAGAGRFAHNHKLLRTLLRQYGLTEIPHTKQIEYNGHASPAQSLLQRVIKESHGIPYQILIKLSFKDLCEHVIGKEATAALISSFGYNAEFEMGNAYSTIHMFQRDFVNRTYYSCKEGMGELVKRMDQHIRNHISLYTSTSVQSIDDRGTHCLVVATDRDNRLRHYTCKTVICAIPKSAFDEISGFTMKQKKLFDTITPVSLHRIYGKFPANPESWFANIPRTTTPDPIRQFIPINKQNGLAMVSYSDAKYADSWKEHANHGTAYLQKEVLKHLHAVFPKVQNIPRPEWLKSYYWSEGVHLWKPGTDVERVLPQIQYINGESGRVFVVGEAFCKIQGWIEGALSTVEDVIPHVIKCV